MRSRAFIFVLAATTGAVTMMLEFVLQRMLSVQWGSSVEVWGSTIAVVLGGLSAGYLLGGWLADRYSPRRVLVMVLAALVWVTMISGLLAAPVLYQLGELLPGVRVGSFAGAAAVLLLPTVLLGAVCPLAVKLLYLDSQHVARVAGRVYAVSTLGSILGALLSAFFLLSALEASFILFLGAVALSLLVIALSFRWTLAVFLLLPSVATCLFWSGLRQTDISGKVLAEQPTRYQTLYVVEAPDGTRRLLTDRSATQSQVDPSSPDRLILPYVQQMQRWGCLAKRPDRVTILGAGAGSLARGAIKIAPKSRVEAVEIDAGVLDISRRYLSLPRGVSYRVSDGRAFLQSNKQGTDVLMVDVFSRGQVPAHMLSAEFFALAHRRLGSGVLIMNLIASPGGRFAASTVEAARQSFPEAQLYALRPGTGRQNLILVAGSSLTADRACLRRLERKVGLAQGTLDRAYPITVPRAEPFTDQRGPVQAD